AAAGEAAAALLRAAPPHYSGATDADEPRIPRLLPPGIRTEHGRNPAGATAYGWGYFGAVHSVGGTLFSDHRGIVGQIMRGWDGRAAAAGAPAGLRAGVEAALLAYRDSPTHTAQDFSQTVVNGGYLMDVPVGGVTYRVKVRLVLGPLDDDAVE